MTLEAGATLQNGRYIIQSVLAESSLDITYEALHAYLNQTVYIKSLQEKHRFPNDEASIRQHFSHQAALFAQSTNAHLVSIVDGFEEDGLPFLVFNPTQGQTLAVWLQDGHWLPSNEAIALIRPLVDAIHSLHQVDIVHGSIDGHTLILRKEHQDLVLADIPLTSFIPNSAIAYSDNRSSSSSSSRKATIAQDIQGLAAIAFALLTGYFKSTHDLIVLAQTSALRSFQHQLSPAIAQALTQGLNPQPHTTVLDWFHSLEMAAVDHHDAPASDENLDIFDEHVAESRSIMVTHGIADQSSMPMPPTDVFLQPHSPEAMVATATESENCIEHLPETNGASNSNEYSAIARNGTDKGRSPISRTRKKRWMIPLTLGVSSMAAACFGGYLGFSFRLQEPEQLEQSPIFGSEIFGTEQAFPMSDQWPGKSSYEADSSQFLFEQRVPQSSYTSPSSLDDDLVVPDIESEIESLPSDYEFLDDVQIGSDFYENWDWDGLPSTQSDSFSTDSSPDDLNPGVAPNPSEPDTPKKPNPAEGLEEENGTLPLDDLSPDIQPEQIETSIPGSQGTTNETAFDLFERIESRSSTTNLPIDLL